jgi:hypothetical protein
LLLQGYCPFASSHECLSLIHVLVCLPRVVNTHIDPE